MRILNAKNKRYLPYLITYFKCLMEPSSTLCMTTLSLTPRILTMTTDPWRDHRNLLTMEESTRSGHFESAVPQIRRKRITRKISRTLSLVVTRVPSLLNVAKFKELGSRDNLTQRTDKRRRPRQIDVTLIVPDKSQRNVSNHTTPHHSYEHNVFSKLGK